MPQGACPPALAVSLYKLNLTKVHTILSAGLRTYVVKSAGPLACKGTVYVLDFMTESHIFCHVEIPQATQQS